MTNNRDILGLKACRTRSDFCHQQQKLQCLKIKAAIIGDKNRTCAVVKDKRFSVADFYMKPVWYFKSVGDNKNL